MLSSAIAIRQTIEMKKKKKKNQIPAKLLHQQSHFSAVMGDGGRRYMFRMAGQEESF